jgi:hypothetical protein
MIRKGYLVRGIQFPIVPTFFFARSPDAPNTGGKDVSDSKVGAWRCETLADYDSVVSEFMLDRSHRRDGARV